MGRLGQPVSGRLACQCEIRVLGGQVAPHSKDDLDPTVAGGGRGPHSPRCVRGQGGWASPVALNPQCIIFISHLGSHTYPLPGQSAAHGSLNFSFLDSPCGLYVISSCSPPEKSAPYSPSWPQGREGVRCRSLPPKRICSRARARPGMSVCCWGRFFFPPTCKQESSKKASLASQRP